MIDIQARISRESAKESVRATGFLLRRDFTSWAEQIRSRALDPSAFAAFLGTHQIAGTSYLLVSGSSEGKSIGAEFVQTLKRGYVHQWAKSQQLLRQLKSVFDLFAATNQEFILLKGPYTAERFYGDLSARAFLDLDLLVPPKAMAASEAQLCGAGFTKVSRVLGNKAISRFFTHHVEFQKPGVSLELHWCLFRHPSIRIDHECVWSSSGLWRHDGVEYRVLSDAYALEMQAVSIAKDIELGTANLKPMVDLYMMLTALDTKLDWRDFLRHCEKENVLRVVATIIQMCLTLFGARDDCPRASAALQRTNQDQTPMDWSTIYPLFEPGHRVQKRLWALRLFEMSALGYLGWWAVSLPFRVATYRSS